MGDEGLGDESWSLIRGRFFIYIIFILYMLFPPIKVIVYLLSMSINDLIQYIMVANNLPVEMGDSIVMTIRNKTIDELNKYIKGGNNDNIPDSIGTE